jgi:hypothetical protein
VNLRKNTCSLPKTGERAKDSKWPLQIKITLLLQFQIGNQALGTCSAQV